MKKQAIDLKEYKENTWFDVTKKKPALGKTVLVFEQGYGTAGNYFWSYALATYIKHPFDKRRTFFADVLQVKNGSNDPWIYRRVTHWMDLPAAPRKITLSEYTFVHNKKGDY